MTSWHENTSFIICFYTGFHKRPVMQTFDIYLLLTQAVEPLVKLLVIWDAMVLRLCILRPYLTGVVID